MHPSMPDDPFMTCLLAAGNLMIWQDTTDPQCAVWRIAEVPADRGDWAWTELDVYGDLDDSDPDDGHAVIAID